MSINNNRVKLLVIMMISVTFVYFGIQYILPLFLPFAFAYCIASGLLPLVHFLHKKFKMPKLCGGILTLGVVGTGIGWAVFYLLDALLKQLVILLKNMPIYLSILSNYLDRFCEGCDKILGVKLGSMQSFIYSNFDGVLVIVKDKIMPVITTRSINILIGIVGFAGVLLITLVSILLLIKDDEQYKLCFRKSLFYSEIHIVTSKLSQMGVAYLRTQGIMLLLISGLCTAGLLLIGNKYALLIGIAIGIFDAFPILGSGLILVPWGIIELFNKDIFTAAIILTVYLGCQVIRQFLEPKLLGNRIGIKPIFTLMSMYAGIHMFGIAGVILGPVGIVILNTILKECKFRLNLNPIEEEDLKYEDKDFYEV
ncbi:MAG: AI-2E family transporter [Anaerocolumna sp.]